MNSSRRNFLEIALVLGGASAIGCSTSPAPVDAPARTDAPVPPTDTGPFVCATPSATIGANHGHELVVPLADVTAAADRTYDIMGTSVHTHSVTVTATQFAMIALGMDVVVTSTVGSAHMHSVTVRCAA